MPYFKTHTITENVFQLNTKWLKHILLPELWYFNSFWIKFNIFKRNVLVAYSGYNICINDISTLQN